MDVLKGAACRDIVRRVYVRASACRSVGLSVLHVFSEIAIRSGAVVWVSVSTLLLTPCSFAVQAGFVFRMNYVLFLLAVSVVRNVRCHRTGMEGEPSAKLQSESLTTCRRSSFALLANGGRVETTLWFVPTTLCEKKTSLARARVRGQDTLYVPSHPRILLMNANRVRMRMDVRPCHLVEVSKKLTVAAGVAVDATKAVPNDGSSGGVCSGSNTSYPKLCLRRLHLHLLRRLRRLHRLRRRRIGSSAGRRGRTSRRVRRLLRHHHNVCRLVIDLAWHRHHRPIT